MIVSGTGGYWIEHLEELAPELLELVETPFSKGAARVIRHVARTPPPHRLCSSVVRFRFLHFLHFLHGFNMFETSC